MPSSSRSSNTAGRYRPCRWRGRLLLAALLLNSQAAKAVQLPIETLHQPPLQISPPQPLTGLHNWRLHGVFSSGHGQGSAILSLGDSPPINVQPGDLLPQGIQVKAVLGDRLLLQRGTQLGALTLQGVDSGLHRLPEATPEIPPQNLPGLSPSCAPFLLEGVPLDELEALGNCPRLQTQEHSKRHTTP